MNTKEKKRGLKSDSFQLDFWVPGFMQIVGIVIKKRKKLTVYEITWFIFDTFFVKEWQWMASSVT
jgi:hypothetical protein